VERGRREGVSRDSEAELALIGRVQTQDLRAFETLYKHYHPRLWRFLMNFVRRPQLVEEVLNDTMMIVWKRAESFNGTSKLSTWIFAIAYRQALSALRKLDEPVEFEPTTSMNDDMSPESSASVQQVQSRLLDAIRGLSPTHRAVVDLTYYQELNYHDIAHIMNCPVDTVKTRMFHARRHLKRALKGDLDDWLQD
jgi:RNA polymerase sigma factor (sigma-70 family)